MSKANNNWDIKRLGDTGSTISTGPFGTMLHKADYVADGIPLVNPMNLIGSQIVPSKKMMVSAATKQRLENYVLRKGDIVVARRGEMGRCAIVTEAEDGWLCGTGSFFVRLSKSIDPQYFLAFFRSNAVKDVLDQNSIGTTMSSLNHGILNNLEIPLPSLAKQKRIVTVLNEAFEGISKAKAYAKQSMAGARLLFDSRLREQFAIQWRSNKIVSLAELATDIVDGDHLPPPKSSTGVPFVTISNVDKRSHQIDFTDTYFVSREYFDRLTPNKKPRRGDLLYTVTGSFGIPVKIQDDREFCFQRHIGLIRPMSNVSTSWLYYLVRSPQLMEQANEGATGTAQKTVSLSVLRRFRVPQLSLQEQKTMSSDLDTLLQETERLEATQFNKLVALDALKQSILHQAFSGNL
jgi:type I restriction enzyme S subunit